MQRSLGAGRTGPYIPAAGRTQDQLRLCGSHNGDQYQPGHNTLAQSPRARRRWPTWTSHSYKASPRKCWSQQFWRPTVINPLLLGSAAAESISVSKTRQKGDSSDANLGNYHTFDWVQIICLLAFIFSHDTLRFRLESMNQTVKKRGSQTQLLRVLFNFFNRSPPHPHNCQPASPRWQSGRIPIPLPEFLCHCHPSPATTSKSCKAQSFHQTWFHDRWIGFPSPTNPSNQTEAGPTWSPELCSAAGWAVCLQVKLTFVG